LIENSNESDKRNSKMKLLHSLKQDQLWKNKAVFVGLFKGLALLLSGVGILLGQASPPPGTNGGNVPPCPCGCFVVPGSDTIVTTACGEACAIVEDLPPTTREFNFTEEVPYSECASGLRKYSQVMTTKGKRRKTKCSGVRTWNMRREPNITDPNADCSGCSDCPDYSENIECGNVYQLCPPTEEDEAEEAGPKIDKGCVPVPV